MASKLSCTTFSTNRRYGVIYADPPWSFGNRSSKDTEQNPISHDCLDFWTLAALPVAQLAAPNCALFLWANNRLLTRALDLIRAWGFRYKTVGFCWQKLNTTLDVTPFIHQSGSWTPGYPELCLLPVCGKPRVLDPTVQRMLVEMPHEHGRKPDRIREQIESFVPGPYLELFAHSTKAGWDCWGDQLPQFSRKTSYNDQLDLDLG